MDRPTVLLVNKFYHDVGPAGGVGRYLLQEEEDLRAAGWDVIPFAMAEPDARPSRWSDYFMHARDYSQPRRDLRALGDAAALLWNREAARKLDALIQRARPDVAHLHNIYHHLSPSILPVLARHRVPVVMTLHDLRLLCPAIHMLRHGEVCERCRGGRFYEAIRGACVKGSRIASALAAIETAHQRWRRLYERHVALFLCPSRFLREKFVAWGFPAAKLRHLPNFVDTGYWRPDATGGDEPAEPRADAYLYFGRISREKGLETLLAAQALWEADTRSAGPEVVAAVVPELWIAGSGPLSADLERLAATRGLTRVRFLGPLARPELRRRLARCRFTVLPSEWYENAPMAVLESLAAGRPVVGTQLGGTPEMVVDDSTGVLVPPRNPQALVAGLQRARRLSREAETAARIWAERHARREEHMQRLASVLTAVARTGA